MASGAGGSLIPPPSRVSWPWLIVFLVAGILLLWASVWSLLVVADWSWDFLKYVVPGGV